MEVHTDIGGPNERYSKSERLYAFRHCPLGKDLNIQMELSKTLVVSKDGTQEESKSLRLCIHTPTVLSYIHTIPPTKKDIDGLISKLEQLKNHCVD